MSVFNIIEKDGTRVWRKNGMLHRDDDEPAIIHPDGSMEWWYEDSLHRIGKPAYIDADGTQMWYENDILMKTVEPLITSNIKQFMDSQWGSLPSKSITS